MTKTTPDMTYAEYNAAPRLRCSELKHMRVSSMHYKWALDHPTGSTDAMVLGSAVHTAVLEPDRLLLEYRVWAERAMRKGVEVAAPRKGTDWDWFCAHAAAEKLTILTADQYAKCCAIRDAVRSRPEVAALLANSVREQSTFWTDPETGIACKCRADIFCGAPGSGSWELWDLKTSRDINPHSFARDAHKLGYWFQLAMYGAGLAVANETAMLPECGIIAVESSPPHDVALYTLSDIAMKAASNEYHSCLARVKECESTDVWPGAGHGGQLDPPAWAVDQDGPGVDFSGIK